MLRADEDDSLRIHTRSGLGLDTLRGADTFVSMSDVRRMVLKSLARGEVSMAEAAAFAGVERSTVLKWCAAAGIEPHQARAAFLERHWEKVTARAAGDGIRRAPSKRELRMKADRAVKEWDDYHGQTDGLEPAKAPRRRDPPRPAARDGAEVGQSRPPFRFWIEDDDPA